VNHNPGMPFFTCFRINELEEKFRLPRHEVFLILAAGFCCNPRFRLRLRAVEEEKFARNVVPYMRI
jgi:hypothetical protein